MIEPQFQLEIGCLTQRTESFGPWLHDDLERRILGKSARNRIRPIQAAVLKSCFPGQLFDSSFDDRKPCLTKCECDAGSGDECCNQLEENQSTDWSVCEFADTAPGQWDAGCYGRRACTGIADLAFAIAISFVARGCANTTCGRFVQGKPKREYWEYGL